MSAAATSPQDPPHLPGAVRSRIVALTADALPAIATLPPALRKVAAFAPARRARLGATQIAVAVERDDDFREHVATQVSATLPDLAAAVSEGDVPAAADPADVAALVWLLRPEGWEQLLADAVRRVEAQQTAVVSERDTAEVERLRQKVVDAEVATREVRARYKEQIDELKADNAALRRKLGDARSAERTAKEGAGESVQASEQARARAEAVAATGEAEVRRLKQKVDELQASLASARRTVREDRDETTIRARVLLDTLLESAQGLRRELALPAVSGAPADRLESELAEVGTRTPSGAGAFGPSSPALLEQYLSMPRSRLIIDGYNVSKTAWPESSLEAQRIRLLNGIASLVARSGAETTVVFDAASSASRPPVNPPRGVKVIFSPEGVIADDVIRDLVDAEPQGRVVIVVSSDLEVARDISRAGARSIAADALVAVLAR